MNSNYDMISAEYEGILDEIGERILAQENKIAIVNPECMMRMGVVYKIALYLTKGTNAKVTYVMNKPFKSMGAVTIETDEFIITDAIWFSRASELSSNVEIYPLVNGMIRITFTFHKLTVPIG